LDSSEELAISSSGIVTLEHHTKKPISVLHVDDDSAFLDSVKLCLQLQGDFEVYSVCSADGALERLKQETFDVIVSDFAMPEKDGLMFLSELRARGNITPFILFTCNGREEVAAKALNLGAFRYVDKRGNPETVYGELSKGIQQAFEQRQAKEKLHESEEWFRAIHDKQQNGILIIEPDTHMIINANPAALEMIGASKEQVIGRVCHTFVCPAEKGRCPVTDLGQTVNKADKVLVKSDSTRLPILKAVKEVTIGGKHFLIESFVDISEAKRVEEALKESQQKFMALFRENPEAVVFCDRDFRVVDVNPSFVALFGCSSDFVKGKDAVDLFAPEEKKEEASAIREKLREDFMGACTIRKRSSGFPLNISLSGAPVVVNGNVVGYVLVYKNVTDIVVAHEEVSRMFEEQKGMLHQTKLLNEKLSVTGSLTRHDVRNKLGAIAGYLHVAKKRFGSHDELQKYLLEIDEIIRNIVRILDFAKTYEMLGSQEREFVDVGKMVQDAASFFTDLKGVNIVNECDGFLVLADSLLMELFHNLVDNSLKYGKTITQIRVHTKKHEDNSVNLIYEDNGVGIDADMKDVLFQKGFGRGTGYGLYLIKRICEMYGWSILEDGKPGKGVRFVIGMPVETAPRVSA